MDRFFLLIGRVNNVLFLLILLGVAAALSYFALENVFRTTTRPALVTQKTPGTKEPTRLELGLSREVIGSTTTMLDLKTEGYYANLKGSRASGQTRNILFVTGPDKKSGWLFKNHQNLILSAEQVQQVKSSKEHPALAIYVLYVPADTNGDGELSSDDEAVIGIAKPDGSGFLPVVQGVNRVISNEVTQDQQLSFVYRRGATLRHAICSLARFTFEADKEIFNISAQ